MRCTHGDLCAPPHLQDPVPLGTKGAVAVAREGTEKDTAESESIEWDILQWDVYERGRELNWLIERAGTRPKGKEKFKVLTSVPRYATVIPPHPHTSHFLYNLTTPDTAGVT